MKNSGGVQQYQNTHTQDERQDLCLEDGTSKIVWVGNCRILFLEEIWLQEREICTQQDVMDANNFNILWTEASWSGSKYLTLHYPNQGNRLYLKWTPSKTHNRILLKKKWNSISISDQKKKIKNKKNFPWRHMESLWSCHKLGWLAGPQWNLGDTE